MSERKIQLIACELLRISKSDPVRDLAYLAHNLELTEVDVVAATKRLPTVPDSLKIELQNKFRDISRKVKQ